MTLSGFGARALLIGTATHRDTCRLPDVPEVRDAVQDLAQCLVSYCGLDPAHLRQLHDPRRPADIRDALAEIGPHASEVLLVYYAGHGVVSAETGELLLATSAASDLSPDALEDQALPFKRLVRTITERCPASLVIVILDCCFASRAADPGYGWTLLKAAGWDEHALIPPGSRYPAYTGELIRVLAYGDPLGPPQLTVRNVHGFAARVLRRAELPEPRATFGDRSADLIMTVNRAYQQLSPDEPESADGQFFEDSCPYRGLDPYTALDERLFSGRGALTVAVTAAMAQRLWTGGLTLVTGASGSGKSSLLMGGILPSIGRGGLEMPGSARWPRIVFTPGSDPLAALASAAQEALAIPNGLLPWLPGADPERVAALLGERLGAESEPHAVIVVDQAEEMFTLCTDDRARRVFLRLLGALAARRADAGPAAAVVLALRADFFGDCASYPELREAADQDPVLVGPMTTAELREAITQPAANAGLHLEVALADLMIADMGADPADDGFAEYGAGALPLLSFALLGTWQRRQGRRLTLEGYQAAGRVAGSISQAGDDAHEELAASPDAQDALRDLLLSLVSVRRDRPDTRRRRSRTELLALSERPEATRAALESLVRHRLVSVDTDSVQLSHEALIGTWPQLRAWIDQEREGQVARQELADQAARWTNAGRSPSLLYGSDELAGALALIGGRGLHGLPAEFVAASRRRVSRRRMRALVYTSAVTLVAVLAIISSVVAVRSGSEARHQRDLAARQSTIALSRQLAASSLAADPSNPVAARQLAVAAWRVYPTEQAASAMTALVAEQEQDGLLPAARAQVYAVALSPDGKLLATAEGDGTVRLWSTASGQAVRTLHVGRESLIGGVVVAFSPDGKLLVTAGNRGTVRLWDAATGRSVGVLHVDNGSTGYVSCVTFSPDGKLLVTVGGGGAVELWNPAAGELVRQLRGVSGVQAAFSPDGRLLAVADSTDGSVRLLDPATGQPDGPVLGADLTGPDATPESQVAFSPDGSTLAASGNDGVRLWSTASGLLTSRIGGESDGERTIDGLAFSPGGKLLATAGTDGTVRLWDSATGRLARAPLQADASRSGRVNAVAFSADGSLLASADSDGTARLWEAATGLPVDAPLNSGTGSQGVATSVTFSPDGTLIGADTEAGFSTGSGSDAGVQLWETSTGQLIRRFAGPYFGLAFGPDGRVLVTSVDGDRAEVLHEADTVSPRAPLAALGGLDPQAMNGIAASVFSADGKVLAALADAAVGDGDNDILTWDLTRPGLRPRLVSQASDPAAAQPEGIALSRDGHLLAVAYLNGKVQLWQTATGQPAQAPLLTGRKTPVSALAFSPNGKLLAVAEFNGAVRLWNLASRRSRIIRAGAGSQGAVNGIAFSPDGTVLATAVADGNVRLWSTATGLPLQAPFSADPGPAGGVNGVAFSPDGRVLASADNDGTIQRWVISPFRDTYATLCADDGPPTQQVWRQYAPGDPQPAVCGSQSH